MKPSLLFLTVLALLSHAQETPPPVESPEAPAAGLPASNHAADLTAAADKLAAATSYGWSQTTSFGGNFGDRMTTGRKGGGGFMMITLPGRDQEIQVLARKGKAVMQRDGAWVVPDADANGEGPGRWLARMIQNLPEPAVEAKDLAAKAIEVGHDGTQFTAKLTEEAAREMMRFRGAGRRGGGQGAGTGPEITGAGGTVSFTVTDGVLTGYRTTVTGRMNFNGESRDVTRTTQVEFTGIGSTRFDIPEDAAGMLME
jgi:hypothetical protein